MTPRDLTVTSVRGVDEVQRDGTVIRLKMIHRSESYAFRLLENVFFSLFLFMYTQCTIGFESSHLHVSL